MLAPVEPLRLAARPRPQPRPLRAAPSWRSILEAAPAGPCCRVPGVSPPMKSCSWCCAVPDSMASELNETHPMRNFIQAGNTVTVPAPYALTSGQGAKVGQSQALRDPRGSRSHGACG